MAPKLFAASRSHARDVCSIEVVCWRTARLRCFTDFSHDNHRAEAMPQAQAITQCTSPRSDGSPSCLGGSSHGWVPPVLTTVRRLWVAHARRALRRHQMSPRHKNSCNNRVLKFQNLNSRRRRAAGGSPEPTKSEAKMAFGLKGVRAKGGEFQNSAFSFLPPTNSNLFSLSGGLLVDCGRRSRPCP